VSGRAVVGGSTIYALTDPSVQKKIADSKILDLMILVLVFGFR
jgi:hypothetical protein